MSSDRDIYRILESLDAAQKSVKQLPALFKPAQTSPQLDGAYPGRNATRGYMVGEGDESVNPMVQAVHRRIAFTRPEWITKYGMDAIDYAIDDVVGDDWEGEEIGSSDVSHYIHMIGEYLRDRAGSREEMDDRKPFSEHDGRDDEPEEIDDDGRTMADRARRDGRGGDDEPETAAQRRRRSLQATRDFNRGRRTDSMREGVAEATGNPGMPHDFTAVQPGAEVWYKGRFAGWTTGKVYDDPYGKHGKMVAFDPNPSEFPGDEGRVLSLPYDQVSLRKSTSIGKLKGPGQGVSEGKEAATEDVLSSMKKKLGDYLQDVATAIKKDPDLKDKVPQAADQISAVKTITTDDGHEIKIHGNEDDGFRVTIRNKELTSKFRDLDEATMACEMYCARRRQAAESADYIEEKR